MKSKTKCQLFTDLLTLSTHSLKRNANNKRSLQSMLNLMMEAMEKFKLTLKEAWNDETFFIEKEDLQFAKEVDGEMQVHEGTYSGWRVSIKMYPFIAPKTHEEFLIASAIRSPHIVKFFGACLEPHICMVTEYCALGNLYGFLNDPTVTLSWSQALDIALGVARGVEFLHTFRPNPVVHGGLSSRNIMVCHRKLSCKILNIFSRVFPALFFVSWLIQFFFFYDNIADWHLRREVVRLIQLSLCQRRQHSKPRRTPRRLLSESSGSIQRTPSARDLQRCREHVQVGRVQLWHCTVRAGREGDDGQLWAPLWWHQGEGSRSTGGYDCGEIPSPEFALAVPYFLVKSYRALFGCQSWQATDQFRPSPNADLWRGWQERDADRRKGTHSQVSYQEKSNSLKLFPQL